MKLMVSLVGLSMFTGCVADESLDDSMSRKYFPLIATLFIFILVMNLWELIPVAQVPVTSHFAVPVFLAMMVWFIYNIVGIKAQGFGHYIKNMCIPPGVPKIRSP